MRYLIWSTVDCGWVHLDHEEERSDEGWVATTDLSKATKFFPIDVALQLSLSHDPDDLKLFPYPEDVRREIDQHVLECQELLRDAAAILGVEPPEDGYDTLDHTRILSALQDHFVKNGHL